MVSRGETDTIEKMRRRVEYDLYYIDNWSFLFDQKIIILTLLSKRAYLNAFRPLRDCEVTTCRWQNSPTRRSRGSLPRPDSPSSFRPDDVNVCVRQLRHRHVFQRHGISPGYPQSQRRCPPALHARGQLQIGERRMAELNDVMRCSGEPEIEQDVVARNLAQRRTCRRPG